VTVSAGCRLLENCGDNSCETDIIIPPCVFNYELRNAFRYSRPASVKVRHAEKSQSTRPKAEGELTIANSLATASYPVPLLYALSAP